MKKLSTLFVIIPLTICVFAQAPDNFIYHEIVYDTTCNTFVAQIDLPQPYKDLFLTNQTWNKKISNYENISGNLLNQEAFHQIDHVQNQNFYFSHYKPMLHTSNNFYFSMDSLSSKKSSHIGHFPKPAFVVVCAGIGGLAGAVKGVSKNYGEGYILSNIVLGILVGSGAAYVLAAIFH
jgi:hypothetical protein